MSAVLPSRKPILGLREASFDISISLIDSLYRDAPTFVAGSILVTGPAFIVYWKTGNTLLLACALALALVACARGILMYSYFRARSTITRMEVARRWERRYLAGATLSHALLGIWCFVAFAQATDPFVYFFSFCMTIIYAAGVFGRNFAN